MKYAWIAYHLTRSGKAGPPSRFRNRREAYAFAERVGGIGKMQVRRIALSAIEWERIP
jgi:hypothetical protein